MRMAIRLFTWSYIYHGEVCPLSKYGLCRQRKPHADCQALLDIVTGMQRHRLDPRIRSLEHGLGCEENFRLLPKQAECGSAWLVLVLQHYRSEDLQTTSGVTMTILNSIDSGRHARPGLLMTPYLKVVWCLRKLVLSHCTACTTWYNSLVSWYCEI